jgi:hypothetical protein
MQISELKSFAADKPRGDPSLAGSPVAVTLSTPSRTINIPDPANGAGGPGCVTRSGGAGMSVAIVNASSSPDPAGYFNLGADIEPAAEAPGGAPAIEPPITFDPTQADVVVSGLSVNGNLAATFPIRGPAAPGLDGSLCLDAGACMAFSRATPVPDAVKAATEGFKSVFALPDLFARLKARAGDFHDACPAWASDFSPPAAQRYGCRAIASILIMAASDPHLLAPMVRSVQISWTDAAGKTRTTVARQGQSTP